MIIFFLDQNPLYDNYIQFIEMSTQQIPILKQLQENVDQDARRDSKRLSAKELGVIPQSEQKPTQSFDKTEKTTNVNIFLSKPKEKQSNIFSQSQRKSVNLFTISSSPSENIFTKALNEEPQIKDPQSDDQESENYSLSQKSEQNRVRQMNYEYKNPFQRLQEFKLKKFRNGQQNSLENVWISIQKNPKNEQFLFIFLRNQIKSVILYNYYAIPKISQAEIFMNNSVNLKMNVFKLKDKIQEEKKVESKSTCERFTIKMQFDNAEQCQKFRDMINEKLVIPEETK